LRRRRGSGNLGAGFSLTRPDGFGTRDERRGEPQPQLRPIVETAVHATGFDAATVSARSGNGFVSLVASDDPMHTVELAQYDARARADAGVLHRLADAGC
jgi:hypothetical protein